MSAVRAMLRRITPEPSFNRCVLAFLALKPAAGWASRLRTSGVAAAGAGLAGRQPDRVRSWRRPPRRVKQTETLLAYLLSSEAGPDWGIGPRAACGVWGGGLKRSIWRGCVRAMAAMAVVVTCGAANGGARAADGAAAAEAWPEAPFAYVALRQDLRRYLREFARWSGLFLNLHRDVQGVVEGPLPPASPEALLDRLASAHGFFWWRDGAVLHVGPSGALITETAPIGPERAAAAKAAFAEMGLIEPRFPVRIDGRSGFISATGPEDYVRRIIAVAQSAALEAADQAPSGPFRSVVIYRDGAASRVRVPRRASVRTKAGAEGDQ